MPTLTIVLRSRALPHTLAYAGSVVGLVMLHFPVWVLLVSASTLVAERRAATDAADAGDG